MTDADTSRQLVGQSIDQRRVGWHISTRSPDTHGSCVEAGAVEDGSARVAVRHSHHPDGPNTVYSRTEWHAFLTAAKHGHYDF